MKLMLTALAGSFVLIAACSASASAQDSRSLYYAADQYRDAVVHFEDEARRVPSLDRFTLRLIDRLEDQTSDLRSTSRRVSDLSRLLYEFNEVQSLQPRVEQAVFGTGCPIIQAALGSCWNEVTLAYTLLASEIQTVQSPLYQSGYGSRPSCGHPLTSRGRSFRPVVPVVPSPHVRVPQTPVPHVTLPRVQAPFGPQASHRFPQQDRRYDRYQSARPDAGSLIINSLLSRFTRGL